MVAIVGFVVVDFSGVTLFVDVHTVVPGGKPAQREVAIGIGLRAAVARPPHVFLDAHTGILEAIGAVRHTPGNAAAQRQREVDSGLIRYPRRERDRIGVVVIRLLLPVFTHVVITWALRPALTACLNLPGCVQRQPRNRVASFGIRTLPVTADGEIYRDVGQRLVGFSIAHHAGDRSRRIEGEVDAGLELIDACGQRDEVGVFPVGSFLPVFLHMVTAWALWPAPPACPYSEGLIQRQTFQGIAALAICAAPIATPVDIHRNVGQRGDTIRREDGTGNRTGGIEHKVDVRRVVGCSHRDRCRAVEIIGVVVELVAVVIGRYVHAVCAGGQAVEGEGVRPRQEYVDLTLQMLVGRKVVDAHLHVVEYAAV